MKNLLLFLILFYGLLAEMPKNWLSMQKIEKNGMEVTWEIKDKVIEFEVKAPSKGWLAIGFNKKEQLVGSNLIMAAVKDGKCIISDRYIVGFGNHKSVESLGGINHLSNISGQEDQKGTTVKFSVQKEKQDEFHFPLKKGCRYSLLIAYATHDDFSHHSRMRTTVDIRL
jgi:hypothetical protein